MELTPKEKGNLTELQCLVAFAEQGLKVSIPYGENCRYDFILDIKGTLLKIQCKTSSLKEEGVYKFQTSSSRANTKGMTRISYEKEDVDYFCTFINEKCYLIPFDETASREKVLRFVPPKNNLHVYPLPRIAPEQICLLMLNFSNRNCIRCNF